MKLGNENKCCLCETCGRFLSFDKECVVDHMTEKPLNYPDKNKKDCVWYYKNWKSEINTPLTKDPYKSDLGSYTIFCTNEDSKKLYDKNFNEYMKLPKEELVKLIIGERP